MDNPQELNNPPELIQQIIQQMFERGILLNQEMVRQNVPASLVDTIESEADLIVLTADYAVVLTQPASFVDWYEIDRDRVRAEKYHDDELYQRHLQDWKKTAVTASAASSTGITATATTSTATITTLEMELKTAEPEVTFSLLPPAAYPENSLIMEQSRSLSFPLSLPEKVTIFITPKAVARKYEVKDFTSLFLSRYRYLSGLLRHRQELISALPISRLTSLKERQTVALIAMVAEIKTTKTGNTLLTLEDPTGQLRALVSKAKEELLAAAKDLVHDEVIGVVGTYSDQMLFVDALIWPDLPVLDLKKNPDVDEYAIFLSDIHVGSALFLKDEFEKLVLWINGHIGNDQQREIAEKVKYIFIAGDLVDGVGIYPAQESELAITDIHRQYQEFTRLIKRFPPDKQIIICPGNHDVVHLAEPQPALYPDYAAELLTLPHVFLVPNPSWITIGKTNTFPGFDVLLYHGYCFDYYVANVESIRANGGYRRADLIMKFLLKRRHLAPSFKSTPYYPGQADDPLLIRQVPDFLVTGHIHYSHINNYKSVTMISGSCWQGKTSFQEKLGHDPEPARVPWVNLRTREMKILKFGAL